MVVNGSTIIQRSFNSRLGVRSNTNSGKPVHSYRCIDVTTRYNTTIQRSNANTD